uniref:Uncharacterized protein n=1 Tax=Spongospora subterranea TaxID=70186 RepID=A0A0H5R5K7_9EUKA|eukprot:CRZ09418.1 hypothetical protein [Spongospora subterranea]
MPDTALAGAPSSKPKTSKKSERRRNKAKQDPFVSNPISRKPSTVVPDVEGLHPTRRSGAVDASQTQSQSNHNLVQDAEFDISDNFQALPSCNLQRKRIQKQSKETSTKRLKFADTAGMYLETVHHIENCHYGTYDDNPSPNGSPFAPCSHLCNIL